MSVWMGEATGTVDTFEERALAVRNTLLSSRQKTATQGMEDQWTAAIASALEIMNALDPEATFNVHLQGNDEPSVFLAITVSIANA